MERLKGQGKKFIDQQGCERILYGINMVCKDASRGYLGDYVEEDFKKLKAWGFNVVRLGVSWAALEPQPMQYNEAYIKGLEKFILWAKQYDIYIFLDMHQDLYSCQYSNGAPDWATLTEGKAHTTTDLWNESYFLSEAVKTAFTNFWNNSEVEGQGLQDYYAKAFGYLAHRVGYHENILGFDLMNEPTPGKMTDEILEALAYGYKTLVLKDSELGVEQVISMWLGEEGDQIMQVLQDMSIYQPLVRQVQGVLQEFDKKYLMPFYNKVAQVIHEVAPETMMFCESSYFSNMGMMSGIERLANHIPGVYAPHGYDLVVDTDHYTDYNFERVEFIFDTHRQVQQRLNIPTLIGEWGAFYTLPHTAQLAQHIVGILEKYHWSSTYWDYSREMENLDVFRGLVRAYPQKIQGELIDYHYDYENRRFKCSYKPEHSGEIVIYLPYLLGLKREHIKLNVMADIILEEIEKGPGGYIYIKPREYAELISIELMSK